MGHDISFFRDEIRNGFYIPTAVKQSWACSLDILSVIDTICQRHDIMYFADWGTLLGAVRHGGFVPWDDDLDICMKRDDYIRFRAVADAELPTGYVIHDYERQEDHWLFLSRVVNSSRISFNEAYLDSHYNFPWLSGVDIFVKDYLYKNPEDEKKRCDEVTEIIAVAEGIMTDALSSAARKNKLSEYAVKYGFSFPDTSDARTLAVALYKLAEQQMARVPESESDSVGQIFPWIMKGGMSEPKEFYESAMHLPFEDGKISVPSHFNQVLSHRYGNYNEIRKVWDGHEYPAFDHQRRNFEKTFGVELPRFKYSEELLKRQAVTVSHSGNRKVVFLPIGPAEWSCLAPSYEKESSIPGTEVFVVPLPLLYKNYAGQIATSNEEILSASDISRYPEGLPLYDWSEFDLEALHPDIIYIQNPYDNENPCLTVPDYYYSAELQKYTPKLVYVPLGPTSEFTEKDIVDQISLGFFATTPGMFYADEVLVQSDNIRKQYISKLTDFSEESLRDHWGKKIIAVPDLYGDSNDNSGTASPKKLLFCISSYEAIEHSKRLLSALRERVDIFKEATGKVEITVCSYPPDEETAGEFISLAEKSALPLDYITYDLGDLEYIASVFDAYYGSSSPLVPVFVAHKKPVMISDYEL